MWRPLYPQITEPFLMWIIKMMDSLQSKISVFFAFISFLFSFLFLSHPGLCVHIIGTQHLSHMAVMNWSNMISHFVDTPPHPTQCLSLHHFIFLCSRMWLMVILCMVAGFLLCCTWVPHYKDIRREKKLCCSPCWLLNFIVLFVFDREREMLNLEQ